MFVHVKCQCGRNLRTRLSESTTEIQCWDCHSSVRVPRYRARGRPLRERLRDTFYGSSMETFAGGVLSAMAVTAALSVPKVGMWVGLVALAGLVPFYLDRLRGAEAKPEVDEAESDEEATEFVAEKSLPERIRAVLSWWLRGLVVGAILVFPLWFGYQKPLGTIDQLPWAWPFLLGIVTVLAWVVLPLGIYAATARDREGRVGPRRALAAAVQYPITTITAILLVPVTLFALEVMVAGALWTLGAFPLAVFDLFPIPEALDISQTEGAVLIGPDYRGDFNTAARDVYVHSMREGSSLVAAIPLSLERALATNVRVSFSTAQFWPKSYLALRGLVSIVIISAAALAFFSQATWLGQLPARVEEE